MSNFSFFCKFIKNSSYIFNNLVCGLAAGLMTYISNIVYPYFQIDKVIIGSIMLLVPGLVLVNAVRDLLAGDIVAGAARLLEAFLIALAIAAGTGISLLIRLTAGGGV